MESEITILISAMRAKSRWAFEIQGSHRFAKFAGGVLPGATSDTLLAFSLTTALKSIPAQRVANHLVKTGAYATIQEALSAKPKLRLTVKTSGPEFFDSLRCVASLSERKLRVADRFVRELVRELTRFDVKLVVAERSEFSKVCMFGNLLVGQADVGDGWPPVPLAASY